MAKTVFRPFEVVVSGGRVDLAPPTDFPELAGILREEEERDKAGEEAEVYQGPTAEDLRREAEEYKAKWETEKAAMLEDAKAEAARIIAEAEEAAFKEVQRKTSEAQALKQDALSEADRLLSEAASKAKDEEAASRASLEAERKEAEDRARAEGREEGYAEGKAEADRLVERTRTVLERAQDKREEILAETEGEIIDLVLLIARKVIKTISETQRGIILQNVVQALRKVRARGNVIIRVNLADLKLTTEHTKDFIKMMEGASGIQVVEDSSVDEGGCIIETDFGEIDARVSSQLAELENKIKDLSPITARPKPKALPEGRETRPAQEGGASPS